LALETVTIRLWPYRRNSGSVFPDIQEDVTNSSSAAAEGLVLERPPPRVLRALRVQSVL